MRCLTTPLLLVSAALSLSVMADDPSFTLTRQGGHFSPSPLVVPIHLKIRLVVDNQDQDAMEFESESLSWEIVIPPHHSTVLYLNPLEPGRYGYFNDNDPQQKGIIEAR